MGLIARQLEEAGIATVSLSCAYSITESVKPPRSLYMDFPLGRTAGAAGDEAMQDKILEAALSLFEREDLEPGVIVESGIRWPAGEGWKAGVMTDDKRTVRGGTPQYQLPEDELRFQESGTCKTCIFVEETP